MYIKLQRMDRHEIEELIPFKFAGELDYSYFVNIVHENSVTEELLELISKKLEINRAYFYMQIDHMMEDNIIEYCKVKKIDLNFLQKVGNYKFAQILIKDVKTFLQMFHIVNILTVNMENITLFSTEANLKISTNQRNKGFFKAFPIELELTETTTILVPDDTNSFFTFYSNEAKFSPESLKLIFLERMIDIY
ncbi:hypothetical protein ACQKMD_15770 [Viridibacillus sp. NPDC096237]|uniref:hypothetical protein n=1 Tax=Viridibacillus sp. NPDC096237 TaxID=3390721 RepID=UPI003CFE383E